MEADKTGDHPPPKRPMSVYNCFVRAKTKELTEGGNKMSAPEAMKAAAAAYKAAEASELAPHEKAHEEDKRRYEK